MDLSHELKSPLTKIKAIAAILLRDLKRKELTPDQVEDYLKRIDESATKLNEVVDKKISHE